MLKIPTYTYIPCQITIQFNFFAGNGRDPTQLEEAGISGLATIKQEENDYHINGTIAFIQDSSESPLNIQGVVTGVMPHVKHSIIIGNDCNASAEHSNPENVRVKSKSLFQLATLSVHPFVCLSIHLSVQNQLYQIKNGY